MRFLEGVLAAQRCGWNQAQKVLALLGTYRREDLPAALDRAVRYGARCDLVVIDEFGFDRIERGECPRRPASSTR